MRPRWRRSAPLALAFLVLPACSRSEASSNVSAEPPSQTAPPPSASAAPKAAKPSTGGQPLVLARGVRFVKAGPDNDVAALVRSERDKASADGRDLVVYVGAKWCEPCKHFHTAALRGDLDGEFPDLTILEFDLDEDRDRITAAGYMSKLIPLFVFPGANGRASERRFEGSVKGDGAVTNITPRLRALLGK